MTRIPPDIMVKKMVFLVVCMLALIPGLSRSLTLDEALTLATESLPVYQAARLRVLSSEALYKATISPYFPRLDGSAAYRRISNTDDFDTRTYELRLSYLLFDGGERRANRSIERLNLENDREALRTTLIDLHYNVKIAFYTAIAQQESLAQRSIQLQDAQKDFEVAEGRYKFGVAKLSDMLQASVRLEQARFNLIQAEGDLAKAFADLNSLIGKPLDSRYPLEGSLDRETRVPDKRYFLDAALQKPEIRQAENAVRIAEQNRSLVRSTFFPLISAEASYQKTSGGGSFRFAFPEEKSAGITATWSLFDLSRFFRYRSAGIERAVSSEQLNETKRQLLLSVDRAYEDVTIASNQLNVARQQLKQAEHNYAQAFGEYKVGKADILSLVQAESFLATAREQLISSRLNLILSLSLLERTSGTLALSLTPGSPGSEAPKTAAP